MEQDALDKQEICGTIIHINHQKDILGHNTTGYKA